MQTKIFLITLIVTSIGINAQNTFPTTGNVGIGTTSPGTLFTIFSNKPNDHWLTRMNTNGNNWSGFWEASDNISMILRDVNGNPDVLLAPNGPSYINGGNVGIGTVSPIAPLSVKSNSVSSSNSGFALEANNSNYALVRIAEKSTNGARLHMYEEGVEKIAFYTDGTNNHISAGNLGIGTTNPDMKLTVKGKIHAEEVKIDLSVPAPDYVFREDYELRTLNEVEQFIKENEHLPEIPSAKEFEQNGVMLAEMDMNLLKKIEELTLYTIQQEKKINKLEKENQELKSLADRLTKVEELLLDSKK